MDTIEIKEIPIRRRNLDFEILRINYQFNIDLLRDIVSNMSLRFKPVLKDGYNTYSGLGLQFHDSTNPIYDCVEQSSFISPEGKSILNRPESPYAFTEKNELGKELSFIFDVFDSIKLFRGRILHAQPGHRHAEHVDGRLDCRIHIPVFTNRYSLMYFGDKPYHLPADGSSYLCNTSRPHHFVNLGETERSHIVFLV